MTIQIVKEGNDHIRIETDENGKVLSREKLVSKSKKQPVQQAPVAVATKPKKKEYVKIETFNTFNKRPLPKRGSDLVTKALEVAEAIVAKENDGVSAEMWCTVPYLCEQVEKTYEDEDCFKRWWIDRLLSELSFYIWNNVPTGSGKNADRGVDDATAKFLKSYA